jgi:hypothetical protein
MYKIYVTLFLFLDFAPVVLFLILDIALVGCICFWTLPWWFYFSSRTLHQLFYFCSWTLHRWFFRSCLYLYVLKHVLHLKGLALVWEILWTPRLDKLEKRFPHRLHWGSSLLEWYICLCRCRLEWDPKNFPHASHCRGFFPDSIFRLRYVSNPTEAER